MIANLSTNLQNHAAKFIKYFFVGGSAALINWAVFFTLHKVLLWQYLLAGILAFLVATLWNFILAKKFIFKGFKYRILKESALIYLASFAGLLFDLAILFVCVSFLKIDEMLSKIIASALAFIFNFSIRNFVIYKENL